MHASAPFRIGCSIPDSRSSSWDWHSRCGRTGRWDACFSLIVQVQTDHRVVDTGPYRFVRHPGYAGVLLGFLGLGLALQSWAALLVMAVATPAALAYRLRVEEQFLITELGDEYVRYARRTKRLIPYVW